MVKNTEEILAFIKCEEVKFIDFRFSDFNGLWHSIAYSANFVDHNILQNERPHFWISEYSSIFL